MDFKKISLIGAGFALLMSVGTTASAYGWNGGHGWQGGHQYRGHGYRYRGHGYRRWNRGHRGYRGYRGYRRGGHHY